MDPSLASKIVPPVKKLDPEINKIIKEFAGHFKTRLVKAQPDDKRTAGTETDLLLFSGQDEAEGTESVAVL